MNSILEVFIKISENEGIKITQLEEKIGASKGVLSRAIKNKSDIQAKWLLKLVENYPNYNPEWLLTGQGSMLKGDRNITSGGNNSGVNNTGDIGNNNDITINQGYTEKENKQNIVESQEHNNEIINLLKSQLKDKEEKEALYKEKIADLERRLAFAEVKDKEEMSLKIKTQRKKIKDIISEKDEIIFAQNEELNAMKSLYRPNPPEQPQPSKRN